MGLMDIIGTIFGGAGGQDNLLNSLLVSGLAGGAGALNNRPRTTTFQKQTDPVLDPATMGLRNNLIGQSNNLLNKDPDLRGYTAQGLSNINAGSNAQNNVLKQTLASRGLTYSPLASAEQAGLNQEQGKQSVDFLNQVPLLKNQLLQQRLSNVTNTFRSLPYGEKSSGKEVVSGNMLGGALTGLLAALASRKKSGGGGAPGTGSGGGNPTQQQINDWWKQITGSGGSSTWPFPDPTQTQQPSDVQSRVLDGSDPYGIYGFGQLPPGWNDSGASTNPWEGMLSGIPQSLPGAPEYNPNQTVFSGPFDLGGGYGDFGGFGGGGGGGDFGGSQPGMFDL